MPNYSYPFGQRGMSPRPSGRPSGEEIQQLVRAYQALRTKAEQQAQLLEAQQRELDSKKREGATNGEMVADLRRELGIKDEMLRRQADALKQTETELVFARAGLQQQEKQEQQKNSADEQSWRERYIRLQAELDNLRRRWEQRFEVETANARQEILRDMLPLADHLELALEHGNAALAEGQDISTSEHVKSINATLQAFLNSLKRYQVTPIDALGSVFDPNLHEAVGRIATDDVPSGHVAQVLQTGYMEGDKLLRPARVLVRE